MFLPLSQLKILRSSVRKGKTGPRVGSTCIFLNSTPPYEALDITTKDTILLTAIRAMFIHYGHEGKVRSEIKTFLNVLPCIGDVEREKRIDMALTSFPALISYIREPATAIFKMPYAQQNSLFDRIRLPAFKQYKLIIEDPILEDTRQKPNKIPICIAVCSHIHNEPLPLYVQAKLAVKVVHTMDFANTVRAVGKNSLAHKILDVLMQKEAYHNFINSLKKGEEEFIPILRELQKINANHKRWVFCQHKERIETLVSNRHKAAYLRDRMLFELLPEALTESIFKAGHATKLEYIQTARTRLKERIEASRMPIPIPSACWNALLTHQSLQKLV